MHRLTELFDRLSRDIFPPRDDGIEVVGPPPGVAEVVMAFTNHNVIATSLGEEVVRAQLDPEDLKGPLRPAFLNWMTSPHPQQMRVRCRNFWRVVPTTRPRPCAMRRRSLGAQESRSIGFGSKTKARAWGLAVSRRSARPM